MQTTPYARIASRLSAIVLAVAVVYVVLNAGTVILLMQSEVFTGEAYPIDFAVFWGAARLALDGQALSAFDPEALYTAIRFPTDYALPAHDWRYPPTWHLAISPLGLLPFTLAWGVFNLVGLVIFVMALRPYAARLPGQLNLVLAAPAVLWCVMTGNNGLLFAGVLVFALRALAEGHHLRAGLLIALMTMKPQMGVLVAVALLAGGYWRAILWATLGTLAMALIAGLVHGFEYWQLFFSNLAATSERLSDPDTKFATFTTWFGFARVIGLDDMAAAISLGGLCVGAGLVALVWSRPIRPELKAGVLLLAIPVLSPYAHYYEVTYAVAGFAILFVAGAMRSPLTVLPALAAWILPGVVPYVRDPPVFLWLIAPALTLLVLLAVRDALRDTP